MKDPFKGYTSKNAQGSDSENKLVERKTRFLSGILKTKRKYQNANGVWNLPAKTKLFCDLETSDQSIESSINDTLESIKKITCILTFKYFDEDGKHLRILKSAR